jgi:hypothetical protein
MEPSDQTYIPLLSNDESLRTLPPAQTGVDRIRAERMKQVLRHGYNAEHDAQHERSELLLLVVGLLDELYEVQTNGEEWIDDAVSDLVTRHDEDELIEIAGALLAAELDRRTDDDIVPGEYVRTTSDYEPYVAVLENLLNRAAPHLRDTERAPDRDWWADYLRHVDGGHYVLTQAGYWVEGQCLQEFARLCDGEEELQEFIRDEVNRPEDTDLPQVMTE